MGGLPSAPQLIVLVELLLQLSMHSKGGLPSIRHNEIWDLTATLLTEACSQVVVEPELQPVSHLDYPSSTNIQEGARLDIAMNGFWGGRFERSFVDVSVLTFLLLLMPHLHYLRTTIGMKTSRNMYMHVVYMKWGMPPLLLLLCLPLGVSHIRLQFPTNGWPLC